MEKMNVDALLAKIRAFSETSGLNRTEGTGNIETGQRLNFSEVFKNSLDKVNESQQKANQMAEAFERGDKQADLAQVMIEMQKARVSFEAITQVRNRLISAYHEIMNMQI